MSEDRIRANRDVNLASNASLENIATPPPSGTETEHNVTAFTRPVPSSNCSRQSSAFETTPTSDQHFHSDILRPPAINPNSLSVPLTPIKPSFTSYERPSYIPAFGFNTYPDYVTHQNSLHASRHAQSFPDPPASQPLHPMSFNVNAPPSAHATYWSDPRCHAHSAISDPYSQLSYSNYQHSYDAYKKTSLLRGPVYQDALSR